MKIILLKDIKSVGKKHEVKNVADGFALNSLIPHGIAEVATPKALARLEIIKKSEEADKKVQSDLLAKNIKAIHGVEVEVEAPSNDKGHLFAGLHAAEIAPLIKEKTRIDVLPEFIELEKPVKEVGSHKIDIKVQGKSATFTLVVKAK